MNNNNKHKINLIFFIKLHKSRILNYKNDNFEVQILMATNGEGISIILNCLNGNDFQSSTRVISKFGKFFQLTKTDMKNKDKLGKNYCFAVNTSVSTSLHCLIFTKFQECYFFWEIYRFMELVQMDYWPQTLKQN